MNGKRKYSNDEISAKLKCYGLKLIEYKNVCDVIAEDAEGYRYKVNMGNLKRGRKPNRFASKFFAIYNIKKYLEIHCPTYEL